MGKLIIQSVQSPRVTYVEIQFSLPYVLPTSFHLFTRFCINHIIDTTHEEWKVLAAKQGIAGFWGIGKLWGWVMLVGEALEMAVAKRISSNTVHFAI